MESIEQQSMGTELVNEVLAEVIRSWVAMPSLEDMEDITKEPETDRGELQIEALRDKLEEMVLKQDDLEKEKKKLEEDKKTLAAAKKAFEEALRRFEIDKTAFEREQARKESILGQQQKLFDQKWKILEAELTQLAKDKEEFELHKEFRSKVNEFNRKEAGVTSSDMFFSGIDNEIALRKRYKDLLKIFHPDNDCGDVDTVQVINREYDELKRKYS